MFRGLIAHGQAIRLLAADQRIRRLAAVPFAINVGLFLVGVPFAVWGALSLIESMLGRLDGIAGAGVVGLKVIAVIAVVIGSVFLFGIIGAAIAGPFSGPLSEAVERRERERRGMAPMPSSSRSLLTDVSRGLAYSIGRLILFLLIYPLIFALQLIPGAGQILFTILAFLYSTFVLSVDFSDPLLDRYVDTFRRKLAWVWNRKGLYLGFGAGCVLLMLVPIVNLAMIPVCVVAGTIVGVGEMEKEVAKETGA